MRSIHLIQYVFIMIFMTVYSKVGFAKVESPQLVLDMANNAVLPKRFRIAQPLPAATKSNSLGLAELRIAGSAQFSEQALRVILQQLPALSGVIDLRQESHGFINGNAVSWFNTNNNANLGRSKAQIEIDQQYRLNELLSHQAISIITNVKTAMGSYQYLQIPPREILSEQQLVAKYKLSYQRFYVTDHHAPSALTVNRFIAMMNVMPATKQLLFHCRGGAGRTTTFMVMYDILKNAKRVSFNDIIERQRLLGGSDLSKLPSPTSYRYHLAQQRIHFLKNFYLYCRNNKDNFATPWVEQ